MILKLSRLEYFLGIKLKYITHVISNIDGYYTCRKEIKRNPDGSVRTRYGVVQQRVIYPSHGTLKKIQNRINTGILSRFKYPEFLHGGVKGRDNVRNAKYHQGNKYFFCIDLSDYFPSVDYELVYNTFIQNQFSPDVSRILTQLTTYKGFLPQGAPTSTYLANLVFLPFDYQIYEICKENGIKYTRFIDDFSFSSSRPFGKERAQIIQILRDSGFKINYRKTYAKVGSTIITGVKTKNNTITARSDQYQKLSDPSLSEASRSGLSNYINRIIDTN